MSYGNRSKFYRSKAWQKCREAYLASVGGLCEKCLEQGKITPAVIVHHKEHLQDEFTAEQALNWENLQAVCRDCHAEEHPEVYKSRRITRRYELLPDGTVYLPETEDALPMTPPSK